MKKFTLLIVCFFAALACSAADFDETQLIGKWNVTSATGNWNNSIVSIESIVLGDAVCEYTYQPGERFYACGYLTNSNSMEGPSSTPYNMSVVNLYDFFISNGDKLHIILDDSMTNNSIRLVIKELNDETMTLESFDGTAQFVLSKESAAVQSIQSDTSNQSTTIFDVQGRPVSNTQSGNIYIQGNNKFIAK